MSLSNWTHWLRTKPPIMAPFFAAPNQHSSFTNVKGTGYAFRLVPGIAGCSDAPLILAFLAHLENERHCCPSSRNARLTAIESFFGYVQYRVPSSLEQVRSVLAIPTKRTESRLVNYLSVEEMKALLSGPDPDTDWAFVIGACSS
jgi:integrase